MRETYVDQLLTLGGLTQSEETVEVDGGLLLVSVLHEAERLKVKTGVLAHAVGGDGRLLVHRAAGGHQSFTHINTLPVALWATCCCRPPTYLTKKLCLSVWVKLYGLDVA